MTYVSEYVNYPIFLTEEFDIEISKDINIVFRKDVLIENYESISDQIKQALHKISEEYDLLAQDNLARGGLVESARVIAWWTAPSAEGEKGKWNHEYQSLWQQYETEHPDEYWGKHQHASDVVGGIQRYPWMPADISQLESWFD